MSISPPTSSSSQPPWHLKPEVLRRVITHLPFPGDRACFRAVCRAWHSAARQHVRQLPWIVFPDCSFCTIAAGDDDDDSAAFFHRIPGLPDNVTCCLGAAADGCLVLDCTDDLFRRTSPSDKFLPDGGFLRPRHDVRHNHTYLLHNPFSGETTPLLELDDLFGNVPETFEIRKVLMRSSATTDDVVAYNVVLCRPGTDAVFVLHDFRLIDVEFMGGKLYGTTKDEDLLEFHLAEDEDDGSPVVTKCKRLTKHPMPDDDEEDPWSWMDNDDDDIDDCDDEEDSGEDYEDLSTSSDDDEDDEDSFDGDDDELVADGEDIAVDDEVPYEPKDYIVTTRRLVKSRSGDELLMVKHQMQVPPFTRVYTRKVEVFKADVGAGQWVPVVVTGDVLPEGEALFHSRSFSKATRVYGDVKDGFIYSYGYGRCF